MKKWIATSWVGGIIWLCCCVGSVHAADIYWTNNTSSGNFTNAANWNPNTVPGTADNANFTNNASPTVNWTSDATNSSAFFNARSGTVTLNISNNIWKLLNSFIVGQVAGSTAAVTQTSGTLVVTNSGGTGILAVGQLGQGTFNLNSGTVIADTFVSTNGASSALVFSGGTMDVGHFFFTNTGAFANSALKGGTLNTRGDSLILGGSSLQVSGNAGTLFTWNVLGGTNVVLMNPGAFLQFADGNGQAIVNVSGAGTLLTNSAGLLTFGSNGGRNSQLNISNGAAVATSSGLSLGYNTTSSTNNSLRVTGSGSRLQVGGTLDIGHVGSANSVVMEEGTTNVVGGNVLLGDNALAFNNNALITGPGTLLTNGGSLYVGLGGYGNSLTISNGAAVIVGGGYAIVGYSSAASNNTALVTGPGSLLSAQRVRVGLSDIGTPGAPGGSDSTLTIRDGATVETTEIGVNTGASLTNAGGILQFTVASPLITTSAPPGGNIVVTNGTISFRNVANANPYANVLGSGNRLTNITYQGDNTLRLNNSSNSPVVDYTFTSGQGATNWTRLELVNGGASWFSTNLTIGTSPSSGSMLVSNTTAGAIRLQTNQVNPGNFVINGTATVVNSKLTVDGRVVIPGINFADGVFNIQSSTTVFTRVQQSNNDSFTLISGGKLNIINSVFSNTMLNSDLRIGGASSLVLGRASMLVSNSTIYTGNVNDPGLGPNQLFSFVVGQTSSNSATVVNSTWIASPTTVGTGNVFVVGITGDNGGANPGNVNSNVNANQLVFNNSVVTNLRGIKVSYASAPGTSAYSNDLQIINGSKLYLESAGVGLTVGERRVDDASSLNNRVLVSDNGTLLDLGGAPIKLAGNANQLIVSNGATVRAGTSFVGYVESGLTATSSDAKILVTGPGSLLQLSGALSVGTNALSDGVSPAGHSAGNGGVLIAAGGTLEANTIVAGLNNSGPITNIEGVYQFTTATPTIVPNGSPIVLSNGTISFRNVADANVFGNVNPGGNQLTNVTFLGKNTFRLNNSSNTAAVAQNYVFDATRGPTNYATLELTGSGSLWRGSALTIAESGSLFAMNTASRIASVVTNLGIISVMDSRVTWSSNTVSSGRLILNRSTNTFLQSLEIMPSGTVENQAQEVLSFQADFLIHSTNASVFDLTKSTVEFIGGGQHTNAITGIDMGGGNPNGYSNNFSYGTLHLGVTDELCLECGSVPANNALYVGYLDLGGDTNLVARIHAPANINIYYLPSGLDSRNAYLQDKNYQLTDCNGEATGGMLLVSVPEPSSLMLITAGVCGALARRARRHGTVQPTRKTKPMPVRKVQRPQKICVSRVRRRRLRRMRWFEHMH